MIPPEAHRDLLRLCDACQELNDIIKILLGRCDMEHFKEKADQLEKGIIKMRQKYL